MCRPELLFSNYAPSLSQFLRHQHNNTRASQVISYAYAASPIAILLLNVPHALGTTHAPCSAKTWIPRIHRRMLRDATGTHRSRQFSLNRFLCPRQIANRRSAQTDYDIGNRDVCYGTVMHPPLERAPTTAMPRQYMKPCMQLNSHACSIRMPRNARMRRTNCGTASSTS